MFNKEKFTKMAADVLKKQHGLRDPRIMHPEREWVIGLVIALFIFMGAAYVSVNSYLTNRDSQNNIASDQEESTTVYRDSLVKQVLVLFGERERNLSELVGEAPAPVVEEENASTTAEADISTTTEAVFENTDGETASTSTPE